MQAQDRLRAGDRWQENGLVFTGMTGGPVSQYYFRKAYRAVLVKARIGTMDERGNVRDAQGRKLVPYDMRHTFASHSTDRGMSHEAVAAIMGHKRVATLELVYKDVVKPVIQDTRNVMSGLVREASS
jgi:integrase